jgi:hypothetical protein
MESKNLSLLPLFSAFVLAILIIGLVGWLLNIRFSWIAYQKVKSSFVKIILSTLFLFGKMKLTLYYFLKRPSKEKTIPFVSILESEIVLPTTKRQKSDRQRPSKDTLRANQKKHKRGNSLN